MSPPEELVTSCDLARLRAPVSPNGKALSLISYVQMQAASMAADAKGSRRGTRYRFWQCLFEDRDLREGLLRLGILTAASEACEGFLAVKFADYRPPLDLSDTSAVIQMLRERDGSDCWYCGQHMEWATLEHLIPRSRGGPHALDNLVLAHEDCNQEADDKSLAEKIMLREAMRQDTSRNRPPQRDSATPVL